MAQTDETKNALSPEALRQGADGLIETGRKVLIEAEKMEPGAAPDAQRDAIADYEARFPDGDTSMADEIPADVRRAQKQEDAELDAAIDALIQVHRDAQELCANRETLHSRVITGDGERLEMAEYQIREAAARDPDLRLESPDDEADLAPTDENIAALREYHEQQRRENEIDYDAASDPDYLGALVEAQFTRTADQGSWEHRQADPLRQQQEAVAAGRVAEARGERVIYVHGRPYADPGDDHAPVAVASMPPENLQMIEAASTDMMMALVDRVKGDMTFVRENISQLPAHERGQVTDAYRRVVTEAAAEVEKDRQAERRHEAGNYLDL